MLSADCTLREAIQDYLREVDNQRSARTRDAYRSATGAFAQALAGLKPPVLDTAQVKSLPSSAFRSFLSFLQRKQKGESVYAPATERLYVTAILGLLEHISSFAPQLDLTEVRRYAQKHQRKIPVRQPPFPRDDIEKLLQHVEIAVRGPFADEETQLRAYRDRAILVSLSTTGLRVSELCGLKRGQMDFKEGKAVIIGKGNKQDVVRFSEESLRVIRAYLQLRSRQDSAQGKKLMSALPLFARHDPGAGKKVLPISPRSVQVIVDAQVEAALGKERLEAVPRITPHTFRHYFVTVTMRATGDIQVAQRFARHASISTTQRYAHISDDELDQAYHEVFNTRG